MSSRLVFMTGSIEWDKDPQVSKQRMREAIGDLFIRAGQAVRAGTGEPDAAVPTRFTLFREIDGWDVRFVLRLDPLKEAQVD